MLTGSPSAVVNLTSHVVPPPTLDEKKAIITAIQAQQQAITRTEALRVMTLNNAYLTFEEHLKGSIEAGKLADFVVTSDDLLTVPADRLSAITAVATYVGGRCVFSAHGS